jgi:hypothetical protein
VFSISNCQADADVLAHAQHHSSLVALVGKEIGAMVSRFAQLDFSFSVKEIPDEVPFLFDFWHELLEKERLLVSWS